MREGILIEATSTPPGMGALGYAAVGADLVATLARADHTAALGAMIADGPSGRVLGSRRPLVTYRLAPDDATRLRKALAAVARVLLRPGPSGSNLEPDSRRLARPRGLDELTAPSTCGGSDSPRSTRPARRPPDPTLPATRSAPTGRLARCHGVWVADGSILPSCPGVNPQVSIMALAAGWGWQRGGVG